MSWQAYVDTNLVGTGKVSQAAILGQQGGVWAISSGLQISPEEQAAIVAAHKDLDHVRANGIRIAGVKYFVTSAEGGTVIGKKGEAGVFLVQTKQAILVAIYTAPIQAGEASGIVLGLSDYLVGVGY
ncbi:Profilin/allergen [Pleurotus eryngii]|uniref:Profilin n=1 Tax=Pleurotus eryngii TaxID=5323 RepID=A0A9P6DD67_PLEER|nr:Profilin/allergen [Pleurotus eryngii]